MSYAYAFDDWVLYMCYGVVVVIVVVVVLVCVIVVNDTCFKVVLK